MKIYKVTNRINGKVYIGQTKRTLEIRWKEHCRSKGGCPALHNAIKKYGAENFTVEQIDVACSSDELNKKEIYWITFYDSANKDRGYNLSLGGANVSFNDETKLKMSTSKMGEKNSFYGQHHSEEAKHTMSIWKKEHYCGSNNPSAKRIRCVETNEVFDCGKDACKKYHINKSSLSSCLKGKYKMAGGYHWEYA